MFCSEIAEKVLILGGMPQFVDVGDKHYNAVNRILAKLYKRGIIERCFRSWRLKPLE
jgi:hypothetical protein